jgi:hypothetical protein
VPAKLSQIAWACRLRPRRAWGHVQRVDAHCPYRPAGRTPPSNTPAAAADSDSYLSKLASSEDEALSPGVTIRIPSSSASHLRLLRLSL